MRVDTARDTIATEGQKGSPEVNESRSARFASMFGLGSVVVAEGRESGFLVG